MTKIRKNQHPEYRLWRGVIDRCGSKSHPAYKNYGGRGVTICKQWRDSFSEFLADMGQRPSVKHTIERIDNSRGYEPGNCCWATRKEQARNRRTNRIIKHDGISKCLAAWAEASVVSRDTFMNRIARGWPMDLALTLPSGTRRTKPQS